MVIYLMAIIAQLRKGIAFFTLYKRNKKQNSIQSFPTASQFIKKFGFFLLKLQF